FSHDFELIGNLPDLHREINASSLIHLKSNAAPDFFFKSREFGLHPITADLEARQRVDARFIRKRRSRLIRAGICCGYSHSWQHGAGRVRDGAENSSCDCLRPRNIRSKDDQERYKECFPHRTPPSKIVAKPGKPALSRTRRPKPTPTLALPAATK